MQKVALFSLEDYGNGVRKTLGEALDLIGGIEKIVQPGERVLIKPNLVNDRKGENGDVTHFSLIEPIIKMCSDIGAGEIIVGDGSGEVDTSKAFKASGIQQVVDRFSSDGVPVKLVDLNYDKNPKTGEFDKIDLGGAGQDPHTSARTYRVAHSVLIADTIVSVPKLKTHTRVGISVALKNFVGIAPGGYYGFPKWRGKVGVLPHGPTTLSPVIRQTVVDLSRIALGKYPDSRRERKYLAIVDGVVAGAYLKTNPEGIPLWRPVKVGAIVAGTDPVAVDTVSARVLCYCPEKIELITRAASVGLGTMDDIQIMGDKIEDVRRFVPPPDDFLHIADKSINRVRSRIYRQALGKAGRRTLAPVLRCYRSVRNRFENSS